MLKLNMKISKNPIFQKLYELKDERYQAFSCKLVPNVAKEKILGVQIPKIKNLAKQFFGSQEAQNFVVEMPHYYLEENILHACLISQIKDFEKCMQEIDKFLPFIDNWAVCDTFSPQCFKGNPKPLLKAIQKWLQSSHAYTVRFAIKTLMSCFLDEQFDPKFLQMVAQVKSDDYYVNMMIAWYFATALAKQYADAIKFIESKSLSKWVHNKTIQKARESLRITKQQKAHLQTLKQ